MKTILVLGKVKIEVAGIGTAPISEYINDRLEKVFQEYNTACEGLKAAYRTNLPSYPTVEAEWLKFQDLLGAYNVIQEVLHGNKEVKKTFPNIGGYVERVK